MNWIILDFGSYKLKALKLRCEGNKIRIDDFLQWDSQKEYFEGLDFPTSQAWSATSVALNEAGWMTDEGAAVLSHLPSSYLETRYLHFPFKSEKKIEKVLPLEIESAVPFEVEDILLRHRLLKGDGVVESKDSLVLVLGYQRHLIQKYETELRQFQISIPPISVDALSLVSLRQALPSIYPLVGVLHMGHRRTTWTLFQNSGPVLATRTFWWGGENLIDHISNKLSTSPDQAFQLLKNEATFEVSSESRSIDIELAEALENSLTEFMNEFRQYLKGLQQTGLELPRPLPIYISGKPGQIPGIATRIQERFQEEFEIEANPFPLENLMRQVDGLSSIEDPMAALPAVAQALSQLRTHRAKIPIFSESSFQFQQNLRKIRHQSMELIKRVGILLIVPVVYLVLSLIIHSREEAEVRAKVRELLERNQITYDEGQSTSEILKTLQAEAMMYRQKLDQLKEDSTSPLLILSDLSKVIPSRLKLDLKEFNVTAERVFLTIETDSARTKEEILKSIKEIFPEAKTGATQSCTSYEGCQSFRVELERTAT